MAMVEQMEQEKILHGIMRLLLLNNQGDTIYADGGTDVLVGGQGSDTFDLSNVLDGSTVYIENFTANDNAVLKSRIKYSIKYKYK